LRKCDFGCMHSPIGLHAPTQVRTAPRPEPVSGRKPPEQPDH
jgi:hypothetical protein